jgi:hypothetical protein
MDLHRQVDEVTERYNEDRALRPMVAVIPFIGGPLDAFITARASRLQRERFEHFVEEVRAAYARLDEDKLDQDFIQSEEFFELFVSTVERVTKAYETEKLCALTNAFVNATTTEGSEGPIKEIVVRVTGDLTASHMRLLRVVADRECAFTRADDENAVD